MSDNLKNRSIHNAKGLWNQFISGDRGAFSTLFTESYTGLFRYALNCGLSREQADDAIQEIFIRLFEKPTLIHNPATLLPYLFRSIKNYSLKVYAKSCRHLSISDRESPPFDFTYTLDEQALIGHDPEQLRAELDLLLTALTPRQKEIVYLRLIEELDYESISEVMHITSQVARNLFSKALQRLRERGLESNLYILLPVIFPTAIS